LEAFIRKYLPWANASFKKVAIPDVNNNQHMVDGRYRMKMRGGILKESC
jgi:hypothetical protein